MPQSLHRLSVHIVFSTKQRRPYVTDDIRTRVHGYQARILQHLDCHDIVVGGVADHVHVFCQITRKLAPIKVLEILKKDSSKFVKTLAPDLGLFHWQDGYALFSVGADEIDRVRDYVRNQEEHHRTESFQDEHRRLLDANRVAYDERYVWD